jgi:two-component system NtrC family sensor kinase
LISQREKLSALFAKAWESPGDLAAVQEQILQAALTAFHADICTIFILNPITGELAANPQAAGEFLRGGRELLETPRPHGFTHKVLEERVVLVEEVELDPQWKSTFSNREGIHAFAALALGAQPRPKPFAVLYIDYRQLQRFGDEYRERLEAFSEQASSLLQNAWLLNRYGAVTQVSQEINEELDEVENLFTKLDQHVANILDTSYFFMLAVYVSQTDSMDLYYSYRGKVSSKKESPVTPGCRWVIEERKPLHIHRYSEEAGRLPFTFADFDEADPEEPVSLIFVPLLFRGIPLGVLSIQSLKADAYDDKDFHVLELLANHVSSALNNIRLYEDLDQLSKAGQLLTEQLDAEQVLQSVVERILEVTRADLAVLYPYHQESHQFELPPRTAGKPKVPEFPPPVNCRPGNIPYLVVAREEPLFLPDASRYREELGVAEGHRSGFQEREEIQSFAAVPLRVSGETVGALFVNYRRSQIFNAPRRKVIAGFAVFAAIAINNARKFGRRSARHERELAALERIDAELARTHLLAGVLRVILEGANQVVGAENASILLLDSETLRVADSIGREPKTDERLRLLEIGNRGLTRRAVDDQQTIHVGNVQSDPLWSKVYVEVIHNSVSELDVPLKDEEGALGVINLESPRENAFSDEDKRFIETLAGQVVVAIKKARLYELSQSRADGLEALRELSKEIVRQGVAPDKVMRAIVLRAARLTNASVADLDLYEGGNWVRTYSCMAGQGEEEVQRHDWTRDAPPLPRGIMTHVAKTKHLYRTVVDAPIDPLYKGASDVHCELAVPLLDDNGELIGVLNVDSGKPFEFDESDENLLTLFADETVIAIQNARNYERFRILLELGGQLGDLNDWEKHVPEACRTVTTEASKQLHCLAVVRLYERGTEELVLVKPEGPWETQPFHRMKVTEGVNGEVFRSRRTILIGDTQNPDPLDPPTKLSDSKTRSLLIAPIQLKEDYFGNFGLSHRRPHHFHPADVLMVEGFASLLAVTFHRLKVMRERWELEERNKQAEVMTWVGEASFSLAHRLANDLGLIPTYVDRVRDAMSECKFLNPQVDENLSLIYGDARNVLDLSIKLKQEVGSLKKEVPRIIPVTSFLQEARDTFVEYRDHVEIRFEPTDPDLTVRVVHSQIKDILSNLIINAVEALSARSNGALIIVRAFGQDRQALFQVEDNGPGIQRKHQEKIFQFLYSTKGSSGFGLWSAQRKALANGGKIEVKSNPGWGATFTLVLPRATQKVEAQFAR